MHDRDDLPRLIRAGRHLARPKRYLRHYGRELESVDEPAGRRCARRPRRGDGWVKLVADWIDRDLGADGDLRPLWPADVLADAVAAAHAAGARVTAHTFATESLDALLDAGIDCLEHATGATPDQIDRIAAAGIPVTRDAAADRAVRGHRRPGRRAYPRVRRAHARAARPPVRSSSATCTRPASRCSSAPTPAAPSRTAGSPTRPPSWSAPGIPARDVVAAASWRTRAWLGVRGPRRGRERRTSSSTTRTRARTSRCSPRPRAVVLRGDGRRRGGR